MIMTLSKRNFLAGGIALSALASAPAPASSMGSGSATIACGECLWCDAPCVAETACGKRFGGRAALRLQQH